MPSSLSWNVLFYATARNATEDDVNKRLFNEMTTSLTTSECVISAQIYSPNETVRHWVTNKSRTERPLSFADASRATSLREFINAAAAKFTARSTMLIFCGHGSPIDVLRAIVQQKRFVARNAHDMPLNPRPAGPFSALQRRQPGDTQNWGPDPVTGSFLTNEGLQQGIAQSKLGKVDLLALNACSMGTLEVMYELRNVAAVQLSSQVNAQRWPYREIIRGLAARPFQSPEDLSKVVVACVGAEISANRRDDSVAALRSGTSLDDLARAIGSYAAAADPIIDSNWPAVISSLTRDVHRPDDPFHVDLGSLVQSLGREDELVKAAAAAVFTRLSACVLAQVAHPNRGSLSGLSLFCPIERNIDLSAAYQGLDFSTNPWATLLRKWQAKLPLWA